MKKIIETLKNYYKAIENAEKNSDFFQFIGDYVNFIKENEILKKLIQNETKKKEILLKEINENETEALRELYLAKKKLFKIIKKNKISNQKLNGLINNLNNYEKGEIFSSGFKSDNIERYLWEISKILFQNGYKKFLKEFIDEKPDIPNIYIDNKNFVFSKTIKKRRKIETNIKELRNIELWGCWDYLKIIPDFINKKSFEEIVPENDLGIGKIYAKLINKNHNDTDLIEHYKTCITRIHNYLLKELGKEGNEKNKGNYLRSIILLGNSLMPTDKIFLVLDENYKMPIRCAVKNRKGNETYIKKLYKIAYLANAPGTMVAYDKNLANNINNGLFRKRLVSKYMKTNKLKKPTIVKKSENGKYLVLSNEILVKTGLIKNEVPSKHQYLYIDKTC